MRTFGLLRLSLAFAAILLFGVLSASADVIFSTPNPLPTGQNEVSVTFPNTSQSGAIVYGMAGSIQVKFQTQQSTGSDAQIDDLIIDPNGAPQPSVGAADQSVNNLLITVPGYTFTDFEGDFYGNYSGTSNLPSTSCDINSQFPITVSVTLNDGNASYTYPNPNSGESCHNPFLVTTTNGETISSIFIGDVNSDEAAKFYAFANPAFSGLTVVTSPTPEPGSLLLLGTGLAGVATLLRRKRLL